MTLRHGIVFTVAYLTVWAILLMLYAATWVGIVALIVRICKWAH